MPEEAGCGFIAGQDGVGGCFKKDLSPEGRRRAVVLLQETGLTPILSSGGSAAFHAPLQTGSVTGDRVAAEDAGAGRSASSLWSSAIACSAQA